MFRKFLFAAFLAVFALTDTWTAPARAQGCGGIDLVEVAEFNWPTAAFLANLHRIILERGYGCNVKLVKAELNSTLTRLAAQGKPDIVPEVWLPQNEKLWKQARGNGGAREAGDVLPDGVVEGWWIPRFVAEANPGLRSVSDLPDYRELFEDPTEPQKARLVSCPSVWECAIINRNLLKAYGLDRTFRAYEPDAGVELDAAIIRAHATRFPVLVYHWSPSPVLGRYPMLRLEMNKFNERGHTCNKDTDCSRPYRGSYPTSKVIAGLSSAFAKRAREETRYIAKVSFTTETMNGILAWQSENRASSRATAESYLRRNINQWRGWVSDEAAQRLRDSLS